MAEILDRRTTLKVKEAADGELVCPGCVYVAAPDFHLLISADGTLSLTRTDLVNFVRPSGDLLFESIATSFGRRAIVVVATGTGQDGATGVKAVKRRGGTVLVQDEGTSEFFGMPSAAIGTGDVDLVLALDAIPTTLTRLVAGKSVA